MEEIERLLAELERVPDPKARELARGLVAGLLDLHGAALGRLLAAVPEAQREALVSDELLASVLALHGLHPVALEVRVRRALDQARAAVGAQGAAAELVSVIDGIVRIRVSGKGHARAVALLDEALCAAAPDAMRIVFDEDDHGALVPVERLVGR